MMLILFSLTVGRTDLLLIQQLVCLHFYFVTLLLQYKLLFIVIVVPAPLEPVVKEIIEEEEGPPEVS